jgi:O-succinylbenzoic acid--CoA ligase
LTGPSSFRWIGRIDNLINSGGIKLVPEELEAMMAGKAGLACAVIGIPDPLLGQKPLLVLEKKPGMSSEDLKSLLEAVFPRNRQPAIAWVEKLPVNESYKTDRRAIREMLQGIS